ncbi:MAG TPA: hypothetical protein VGR01_15715 [Burkholderiales bacterium]|jgi:hypothetical protein|nr:hypothetical protein [Burkholderiales bacterium]
MHLLRNRFSVLAAVLSALLIANPGEPVAAGEVADAWAAGLRNLTPAQGRTLMRFARDLFPDEGLKESKLMACLAPYDAEAGDPQKRESLLDSLKQIDGAAMRMGYKDYVGVSHEDERIRLSQMLAEGRGLRQFKKSVGQCLEAN